MGNCQQQVHQQKIFDDKNTVDSQDYQKPEKSHKQDNNHLQPQEKSKMSKKKEQKMDNASLTQFNDFPYTFIRRPAPNFSGMAYYNNGFKKISLRDFKGQYVVLFFFPYDFSDVCRKEILAFSDLNDKFQKAACQVVGCSQDSQFAHMNFSQKKRSEGGLGSLEIPLLSDVDKQISTSYGVVIEDGEAGEKGASFRSTFIIDNHQILRHMSINDISISVNPEEVLRLVHTFQQNDRENPVKGGPSGGCPFAAHAKEMQSNQDIDTFSRYNRKKSEDGSNKNESAKHESKSDKKSQHRLQQPKNEEKQESLLIRLGGELVVQDIADKFVNEIFGDPLLKPFFLNITNQSKQKKAIGSFLKTYFGSPTPYNGRNMRDAHKDLNLNDDHFNKASEFFKKILKDDLKVQPALVQEVMMYIEPLRSQITQKPSQSLYHRVNGEAGIRKAVQHYFNKILQINEIKPFFSKVDTNQIQESYIQYLSLVFGGTTKYKGKQMREAHANLHIQEKIFNFCVVQIQHAFKEQGVDTNSINEIGRLLECLRSEIPKKSNTLYDRLGGIVVIEKAIKKLYEEKIMNEPKIKDFFKHSDMKQLGQKMTDFYIMITGGPFRYTGKSAKDAHHKFNIMSNQFDIYKNILRDTFLELGSTKESVSEFVNLIDTIKIDVIGGRPPSLFEKMGGEDVVSHFVEKLFEKIMEEKRIRHYFINVDLKSVKQHFKEYLNMASGGPLKYQGQNIRDHHEQMDISEKDFNVFMEVVKDTVITVKIKEELQIEVLNFFENMRTMIVSVDD